MLDSARSDEYPRPCCGRFNGGFQCEERKIAGNNDWVDFFDLDDDAEQHAANLRKAGLDAGLIRPDWTLQITPYMLDPSSTAAMAAVYATLQRTITQLPELLFDGDLVAFARSVGFTDDRQLALLDGLARDDGLLPCRWDVCQQGPHWLALEANFGGALGGLPYDALQQVYDRIQAAAGQPLDRWLSAGAALADALQRRASDLTDPCFVVVDDAGQMAQSPLTARAAAALLTEHLGQDVQAIGHDALPAFLDQTDGPVVAFELFTLRDIARAVDSSYQSYLAACRSDRVRRGVNLLCDLYMSKAVLALLHRAADDGQVDEATAAMIRQAVPPTHIVSAANLDALARLPKDRHVLKSAIGHGGSGVFCGWEQDADHWATLLAQAVDPSGKLGLCVLQARVQGECRETISLTPQGQWIDSDAPQVLGIFQIDGKFCGGGVRQSIQGSGIVNAAQSAAVGVFREAPQPAAKTGTAA